MSYVVNITIDYGELGMNMNIGGFSQHPNEEEKLCAANVQDLLYAFAYSRNNEKLTARQQKMLFDILGSDSSNSKLDKLKKERANRKRSINRIEKQIKELSAKADADERRKGLIEAIMAIEDDELPLSYVVVQPRLREKQEKRYIPGYLRNSIIEDESAPIIRSTPFSFDRLWGDNSTYQTWSDNNTQERRDNDE